MGRIDLCRIGPETTAALPDTQPGIFAFGAASNVARTIACLAGNHEIDVAHVSEALQYRVPSDYAQNATPALAANA